MIGLMLILLTICCVLANVAVDMQKPCKDMAEEYMKETYWLEQINVGVARSGSLKVLIQGPDYIRGLEVGMEMSLLESDGLCKIPTGYLTFRKYIIPNAMMGKPKTPYPRT